MTDISKEYGTALFMLACEENCQKQYAEAPGRIRAAFEENPQYLGMLSSPSISLSERLDAIGAAFAAVVPAHVLSYLKSNLFTAHGLRLRDSTLLIPWHRCSR